MAKKKIVLMSTGGTIVSSGESATQTTGYRLGELSINALLDQLPDLKDKIEHEKMTNLLLKNQVNRNFNQEKKEESKSEIFEKQNLKERLNKCEVQLRRVEADLQLERKKLLASEDLCQKLFLSVQSYFRRTFSSVDCLIDFLKFC